MMRTSRRMLAVAVTIGLVLCISACRQDVPQECDCERTTANDFQIKCQRIGLSSMPDWPEGSDFRNRKDAALHGNFSKNSISSINGNYFAEIHFTFLDLSDNSISTWGPEAFVGLGDILKTLDLSRNRIEKLPVAGFENMNALEELRLSYNSISSVCNIRANRIKMLDISYNQINSLGPNCFQGTPEATIINLKGNGLRDIDPIAFEKLPDIEGVVLDSNPLSDPGAALASLPVVKTRRISLSAVGLTSLTPFCHRSRDGERIYGVVFPNMEFLDLSDNYLEDLGEYCFTKFNINPSGQTLPQLEFDLENNRLSDLDGDAFHGLHQRLIKLRLGRNRIFNVGKAFDQLERVEEVYMDHNEMTVIDDICRWTSTSLKVLDLAYNRISEIPQGCLDNKQNLMTLSLRRNHLLSIGPRVVSGLSRLVSLDLTTNILTDLSVDAFVNMPALRKLRLSGNALTTLKECTFTKIRNLQLFYYKNNLLHCDCQLGWLPEYIDQVESRTASATVPLEKDHCYTPLSRRGAEIYGGAGLRPSCIPPKSQSPRIVKCSSSRFSVTTIGDDLYNATVRVDVTGAGDGKMSIVTTMLTVMPSVTQRYPIDTSSGNDSVYLKGMNDTEVYHVCLEIVSPTDPKPYFDCVAWPARLKDPPPPSVAPIAEPVTAVPKDPHNPGAVAAIVLAVLLILIIIIAIIVIVLMWRKMNGRSVPGIVDRVIHARDSNGQAKRRGAQPISTVQANGSGSGVGGSAGMNGKRGIYGDVDDDESLSEVRDETLPLRLGVSSNV